ncbi:MAG: endonuclease MutS2 [candidate division Zixibacteria bacterium]|nr:endonuclease MutS2 [candidate division Zixibacteria bacterium]
MNSHALEVLEFDRIVEKLHGLCWSIPAKRYLIEPTINSDWIEHSLDCLAEMVDVYKSDGGPPTLVFDDIDMMLEKTAAEGVVLEPSELIKTANLYNVVMGFKQLNKKYANIGRICEKLTYSDEITAGINQAILPPNEIKDNATPELKNIRRQIRQTRQRLESKYNSYLESDYAKYLSDNVVTVRDGRFVLPVREGDKNRIQGIVHDRSSTGATFFVEPLDAVEYNNKYRELLAAEKQEIFRILRTLTDLVLESIDSIKSNIKILVELDIYSAKARLAIKLKCSRPKINDESYFDIKRGFHPLLRWRDIQNGNDALVPLDIELGKEFTTLVITGPNTGGKTVALKTVGLVCLMAQSGMFIPAAEGSSVPIFKNIFADIGDEQSLESSLSTFSAHLANIKTALSEAAHECLVLLDEIGAGTDPDEGAALGQAIIEKLTEQNILSIVTTHHGKLKTLAINIEGVQNGSLDFDSRNMKPTYRFRLGTPGLSYAIETAVKIGLDKSITERAESLIDRSERKLARIISELSEKLQATDETLVEAENKRLSYEALSNIYKEKLDNVQQEQKRIKKEALQEAEKMVYKLKGEITDLIDEAKKSDKKVEAFRAAKHQAQEQIQNLNEKIRQFEPPVNQAAADGTEGEKVYLPDLKAIGEIVEKPEPSGKVRVRIGNVILHTEMRKLFKSSEQGEAKAPITHTNPFVNVDPSMEIDLRGMTFDEAQPVLDKYLEDVYQAHLDNVTVIHGKGTGVLRIKVQDYLKRHSKVKSFRLGNWNEGSFGVTIVEIVKD